MKNGTRAAIAVLLVATAGGSALSLPGREYTPAREAKQTPCEANWLSSRCDQAEHAKALDAIAKLRIYYETLDGKSGKTVDMIDELVRKKTIKFYPPEQMSNGDLGNYSPIEPFNTIQLSADWLDDMNFRENPGRPKSILVADMAATIFHENIHRNQGILAYANEFGRETEAWGETIGQIGLWIDARLKKLDGITDPKEFAAEQKLIESVFASWFLKTTGDTFELINAKKMAAINVSGPCGINGQLKGDIKTNAVRLAVFACRDRFRAKKLVSPAPTATHKTRETLDYLAMRFPFFALADLVQIDHARVCNTRMSLDSELVEKAGRPELKNYMLQAEAASMSGDICNVRFRFMRPGASDEILSCAITTISFSGEMGRAAGLPYGGGKCN